MADLIDRAALFANSYILEADYDDGIEPRRAYAISIESVRNAPTVDAVEVVRCKDCKRYQLDSIFHVGFCDGKRCKDDDFCSYGERKEDAT